MSCGLLTSSVLRIQATRHFPGDSDFLFARCIKAHQTNYLNNPFPKTGKQLSGSTMLISRVRQPGKHFGALTRGWCGFHSNIHSFPWRILSSLLPTQTFQNELIFVTIGVCPWYSKDERHIHQNKKHKIPPKQNKTQKTRLQLKCRIAPACLPFFKNSIPFLHFALFPSLIHRVGK